jgi:hypothetical protein
VDVCATPDLNRFPPSFFTFLYSSNDFLLVSFNVTLTDTLKARIAITLVSIFYTRLAISREDEIPFCCDLHTSVWI